MIKTLTNI